MFLNQLESYQDFFSLADAEPLCNFLLDSLRPLFDVLRALIIKENSQSSLVDSCGILIGYFDSKEEKLFKEISIEILEDCQHRLIFKVETMIENEVLNYTLPQKDIAMWSDLAFTGIHPQLNSLSCGSSILQQIKPVLSETVYHEIAQDVMENCLSSILLNSSLISNDLAVSLFQLQHIKLLEASKKSLLITAIREERILDLSEITDAMGQMMSNRSSLFYISQDNSILKLVATKRPKIVSSKIDIDEVLAEKKKESLEHISSAMLNCNDFKALRLSVLKSKACLDHDLYCYLRDNVIAKRNDFHEIEDIV